MAGSDGFRGDGGLPGDGFGHSRDWMDVALDGLEIGSLTHKVQRPQSFPDMILVRRKLRETIAWMYRVLLIVIERPNLARNGSANLHFSYTSNERARIDVITQLQPVSQRTPGWRSDSKRTQHANELRPGGRIFESGQRQG